MPEPGTDLEPAELTPLQKEGAFLDAQGLGPSQIAQALECHPKTVSSWRRQEAYLEERRRWQEFSMERSLTHLRARGTGVADKALTALVEALTAEDPEGHPLHGVRIAAAKEVFASPIIRSLFLQRVGTPGGGGGVQTNVVTVIFQEGDAKTVEGETRTEGGVVAEEADWEPAPEVGS